MVQSQSLDREGRCLYFDVPISSTSACRLPQVIVLGAMDLSIREKTTQGADIFHLKGNSTSGSAPHNLFSTLSHLFARIGCQTLDKFYRLCTIVWGIFGYSSSSSRRTGLGGQELQPWNFGASSFTERHGIRAMRVFDPKGIYTLYS